MLGAETHVGPIDFALNQRLTGPSIYDEYLARRGFGLHHLACMPAAVSAEDDVDKRFVPDGAGVAMAGRIDEQVEFAYFDTEPELGVSIETGSGHAISLPADRVIDSDRGVTRPTASLDEITVVVEDLDRAVSAYTRMLHWGPWTVHQRHDLLADARLDGTPVLVTGRAARTTVGPVIFELAEPGHAPSLERDMLRAAGPGLHHITCALPDLDRARASDVLASHGLGVAMAARSGPSEIWYVDTVVRLKLAFVH